MATGHHNVVPLTPCRVCGSRNDRATELAAGNAKPTPGDLSICINCGAVAVYTDDLHLRPPTDEERDHLPNEALRAIVFIKQRGRIPRKG